MSMISERLSVSHHHFEGYPQKVKTLSVDDSSLENSVNMLGTVYKICIICIVETLKLLGRTIIKATEGSSPKMVDRQPTSPSPRRSSSRIVLIRSIKIERNWLKSKNTQLQLANSGIQATEQRCCESGVVKTTSRLQRVRNLTYPGCNRSKSQIAFPRRRSYPRVQSLSVIKEEEEFLP